MSTYPLLLLSFILLISRVSEAQVRRNTGLIRPNYHYSEVQLHAYTSRLVVKAEHRNQFLQATRAVAQVARRAAGCQSFYFYEDLDSPGTFLLTSVWTSRPTLEAHLATKDMVSYLAQLPHWLATPSPFTFYDIVKAQTTLLPVTQ